ncbi:methyltransferase domain-containing protein [Archangium violaceum]|uniref:class I SAM-dependent methyltransferase n=1 Tax=Archangium violaceum TaxID=83451 RepID=UPI00193C52A3|nr:class I SAM-dependent methyltransferase [Archangium violaceum]QRK07517.1 methyltransferase domain-containing protein [Archangium violaceum]
MSFDYTDDAALYDVVCEDYREDVAFYVEEARRAGGPCLELGCGTGRLLIPAVEAGARVTGLDRSAAMLARARDRVQALPLPLRERVDLREGDMVSFSIEARFALITVPFRTFLHLLTVEEQLAALTNIRRHLLPGGRLVLNFFEPSRLLAELLGNDGPSRGLLKQTGVVVSHPVTGNLLVEWASVTGDPVSQCFTRCLVYDEVEPSGRVVGRSYRRVTSRFIFRSEFEHLLHRAGFQVEALQGSFDGGPVRPGGELIWRARAALS